jgi:hypothetical protein
MWIEKCSCVSHDCATVMGPQLSSSVVETSTTSRVAQSLGVKGPGRRTCAFSCQNTAPNGHVRVGGESPGIVKHMG